MPNMNPTYRPQKSKNGVASASSGDEDPYFQSIYSPSTSSRKQNTSTSDEELLLPLPVFVPSTSEDIQFPWYLMKHHGNTYSKLVQSGVDDTFPEDLLDDSPWSREMVRRGRDSKENQNEKGNVLNNSAGIGEIDLSKLSVRDSKEKGKRKPLGEVHRKQVVDKKNSHPIQPIVTRKSSNLTYTPKKKNENSTPLKSSSYPKTSLQVVTGEPNKKKDQVLTESTSELKFPIPPMSAPGARLILTDDSFLGLPPSQHLIKQIEFWRYGDDLLSQHESLMDTKILGQPKGTYKNLVDNPFELLKRIDLYKKLYNWMITPESIKQEIIGLDLYGENDKPKFRVSIGKCNDWNYFEQQTILTEIFSQCPNPSEAVIEKISRHVQLPVKSVEAFLDNYRKNLKKDDDKM
ncbi:hypothetical protein GCK72_012723 [Caenorhabditis remanei]|uniref:Uncharacterized protein n=1 Tax=Caenorhabditis remanei TaxID=31234 RepID=A0A6A5GLR6_CAERE|nr:hypothetical protein GCK72_012723 [Caenorhabditis remanei]KAF1756270.1 hypothetical protein GCK72_012723 [Caenorhabditis remanei]